MTAQCRIVSIRRSKLLLLLLCTLVVVLVLQSLSSLYSHHQSFQVDGLHRGEGPAPSWDWTRDLPCPADDVTNAADPVCGRPILTMLTSTNDSDVTRARIHNNTIVNWRALGPCVRTLLFVNDTRSKLAAFARRRGWKVEKVKHTMYDIPIFKSLILSAFNLSSTPLYLYANADILFDSTLVTTVFSLLCAIKSNVSRSEADDVNLTSSRNDVKPTSSRFDVVGGIFAVGRRLNVNAVNVTSPLPEDMKQLRSIGRLFIVNAQDYFITTSLVGLGLAPLGTGRVEKDSVASRKNGSQPLAVENNETANTGHFPWETIPNFVIGRPGFDNWAVAKVATRRYNVTWAIDVTDTVLAVHQTGEDGTWSGYSSPANKHTVSVNHWLAGPNYNYEPGWTTCMPWLSTGRVNGSVAFVKRDVQPFCLRVEKKKPTEELSLQKPSKSNKDPTRINVTTQNDITTAGLFFYRLTLPN